MAHLPDKTLAELGWPQILSALAELARSPAGREHALALPFLDGRDAVLQHLGRVAEARRLLALGEEIPLADTPDARAHLGRAGRAGLLEPAALLECARLIRSGARVRRFLHARRELAPMLADEAQSLSDAEPLAAELERAIEPSGTLSDRASVLLGELRERTRGLHRQIKARIDDLLRDEMLEEVLRDRYYSVRGDRYVLPVKASHRSRLPGRVHNASQSGQTLFVEPEQLLDLGNQLTIAQSMAQEEELRILTDFSDAVGRRAPELETDTRLLAELDRVSAAARLSERLGASEPEVLGATQPFAFRGLRHPLLALRGVHVVANDVALDAGRMGLIVSGPNAGGKTVTLTAVGLCALMTRAGLPVPAEPGARVPLYRGIYTAIGDEGDLARDLSTFTAHLTALREILRAAASGTLVCIDELAGDTDPREGAAIAGATIEALIEQGAHVLVTTHLDEVKAKGLTDPRLMSASVGFDLDRLAPTYRLRMNSAGASSAIEIARRVGLPAPLCDRARELLGGGGGELGRAVEALDEEHAEVARLGRALEEERAALALARQEWTRQRDALEARQREVQAGLRAEVLQDIERAREEARRMLARLQQGTASMREAVEAQRQLERQAAEQQAEIARARAHAQALASQEAAVAAPLRPGQRVRIASVGQEGELLALEGEHAVVALGALRTRVPAADLVPLIGRTKNVASFRRTADERQRAVEQARPAPVGAVSSRTDVRGLRADDALGKLREAMDELFARDTQELVVVHGHGTGALKRAVREELESSPYVESFRPGEAGEGGDGVTVVKLRPR